MFLALIDLLMAGILAAYTPEAIVVGQPGQYSTGTQALHEMFQNYLALKPHFTLLDHEIIQSGDTALHMSNWIMKGTLPDGTTIEQSGLSVAVLRKQANGEWRMVIDNPFGGHMITAKAA
jgi:ketosteroid isomerase-like protein